MDYITTVQAADYLNLSPKTLERYRVDGNGPPFHKLGKGKRSRVLYKLDDLETWLQSCRYLSTSQYM